MSDEARHREAPIPTKGSRVRVIAMRSASRPVPPGEVGTVWYVDDLQILVKWDNGRSVPLRPWIDEFELIEP